jgi:hypothetical protein
VLPGTNLGNKYQQTEPALISKTQTTKTKSIYSYHLIIGWYQSWQQVPTNRTCSYQQNPNNKDQEHIFLSFSGKPHKPVDTGIPDGTSIVEQD